MFDITRDGITVASNLASEFDVLAWFHKHTSQSQDWMCAHEGYAVVPSAPHWLDKHIAEQQASHAAAGITPQAFADAADYTEEMERSEAACPHGWSMRSFCQECRIADLSAAAWTEIKLYEDSAHVYWIRGIYKVVSYGDAGSFWAYYIVDGAKNWGDHPSTPPDTNFRGWKCWATLEAAQLACTEHAKTHTPSSATVARAAELLAGLLAEHRTR